MRAITFDDPGDEHVLRITTVPEPLPKPGELLIDVAAAGVNNADLLQRRGAYPVPAGASPILGLEVSGTVAALGDGAFGFAVGDRVCALLAGGGYAERVTVPATQVLPVPETVRLVAAAALPEAACTVYSNVGMIAGLQPAQTLLVHGGTGGMGSHAVLWAKALGAFVVATVGSAQKAAAATALGADVVVNHREEDFVARVLEATAGVGADVVLDVVGAAYLRRNIEVLAPNGHVVMIGAGDGQDALLDVTLLMQKRGSITATSLRPRPLAEKAHIVEAVRYNVWPFLQDGHVRPVVDTVLPLERAADAHRLLAAGGVVGKVLLQTHADSYEHQR